MDLDPPLVRPLKAYAFDPSAGRLLGNEMSVPVRYQELEPGPVVKDGHARDTIAVIDYDGAARKWYRPVDLDHPRILIRGGIDPSESDPYFHQQMVYAVATETIQHFEAALGRQIHWRRAERRTGQSGWLEGDIMTLCLYPHAMVAANAFYSPEAHGILFGYFRADADDPGRNLPGQLVYTCLSHDIVVHEMTHAIIDGIRSHFTEATNPDVAAFHEAFADLAALFRHFTHRDVLLDTIARTGGALHRYQLRPDAAVSADDLYRSPEPKQAEEAEEAEEAPPATEGEKKKRREKGAAALLAAQESGRNPLVELAQQFGEARGMDRGLRSALGTPPRPEDLRTIFEPHLRGSILVAAVFDAYFSIYLRRTADLFRIYRAGGGNTTTMDVPSALAGRLADEASRTADIFFTMCVRALDYCPPVDVTFGDFLRAVVTADIDLHPVDRLGVRDALMQGCRRRGIIPESACFFSEGAIAWPRAQGLPPVAGLDFGDPNGLTGDQKRANAAALRQYIADPAMRNKLGFDPNLDVAVPSFHPVFRVNPDGSLRTDMVVEMVQRREAAFDPDEPRFGTFPFLGGAVVIISRPTVSEQRRGHTGGRIRYVIGKPIHGEVGKAREARQRRYCQGLGLAEGNDPGRFQINLAMVHGGL
jgi:hypothetical protein